MRQLLRWIFTFLFKLLTCVDASGMENIPVSGGCILATNHLSRLDPGLIYIFIYRDDLSGLAADKYQKYPLFRWIINTANGIWIHREEADFRALKAARDYLVNGGMLGIAPEGTRSTNGGLLEGKAGVAYLAEKAGVPVIPIAIWGTDGAMCKALLMQRPRVSIRFGKPLSLQPLERADREAGLQRNTDEIMCQIAAMLPPENRGFYAAHPRLLDLVSTGS